MIDTPATLGAILANKERRAFKQKELLSRHIGASLLSLSINTPGALKLSHEALVIYECAYEAIKTALDSNAFTILEEETYTSISGPEMLLVCQGEAKALKKLTCKLETEHPLGRLMDIDVFDKQGALLSRALVQLPKRRCLLCEKEGHLCAREQTHSYSDLQKQIKHLVHQHAFAASMTVWCERAMLQEVELTPKPGLVDKANSGAHHDMDIETFYASIKAIKPYIKQYVDAALIHASADNAALFTKLREIGIRCERAMFEATQGINTHKGMIFCLAVVSGALGRLHVCQEEFTSKHLQAKMALLCHDLVKNDLKKEQVHSAGARFFYETGNSGIRGVAQSGFAIVCEGSLPFYREQNAHYGEEIALKLTLLWLMEHLEDSTLWSRGGIEGLRFTQQKAHKLLLHVKNQPVDLDTLLDEFNMDMIERHLSPGGSADLLALTWLMGKIVKS